MKNKIKLALLRYSTEKGAILPIVLGFGLITVLVGMTMIVRSGDDSLTASAQRENAKGMSIAEAGVTESLKFLNTVRILADEDLANWQSEYDYSTTVCGVTYNVDAYFNDGWVEINGGKDRYKIVDYDYTAVNPSNVNSPGTGLLTVEGQANFATNPSTTRLQVSIPVNPKTGGVPGLYAQEVNLNNNEVEGDVLLYNCDVNNVDDTNVTGDVTNSAFAEFPDLPPMPSTVADLGAIDGTHDLFNGGSVLTLPVTDTTSPYYVAPDGGRYHYNVDSIDLTGGSQTIEITPGQQVSLYLEGDVNLGGNATILHDCDTVSGCQPTNFQLFGGDGGTDTYNSGKTTVICLSGSSTMDAFIFAPEAKVAVNGSGSGDGITGTVWAKYWNTGEPSSCGSNTGQKVITQAADWTALPIPAPKMISAPSTWQRQTATTP